MIDSVKIKLDNQEFELIYNNETGYYEITLNAPSETGLHNVELYCTNGKDSIIDNIDLIVLKKEEEKAISEEIIAYFLDKKTFDILDVSQLSIDEINIDLETNGNSIFTSLKKINISQGDIIYLKRNDLVDFIGVVESQEKGSNDNAYIITCKYILSLFDVTMFVEKENIISTTGIEDFIVQMINDEFINNEDTFVNKQYLTGEALTHNPKSIQINSITNVNNSTYNLLTFINNCIQKYDIKINFMLSKNGIHLTVETKSDNDILIDATTTDILNYTEIYALSYVAKVIVLNTENNTKYYRYLLSDRTTTTDKNNPDRVYGKVEKITVSSEEDIEQAALDVFKGNSYEHNITFDIKKDSKLMDVSDLKIGQSILIKTKDNILQNTYISKIVDNDSNYLTLTCGNIRINYIDKFLKERRSL